MKLEHLITLLNAGYSKDEISALLKAEHPEPEKEAKEATETKPEPKQEPKQEPKAEPDKDKKTEPVPEYIKQLTASMDALKKAVEVSNLQAGRQPEKKRTVEEILAGAMKEE
jgi:DNA-binding transcriptional MerR regulator